MKNGVAQIANQKWNDFEETGVRRKEALASISVSGAMTKPDNNMPASIVGGRFNPYANILYASLDADKANRIYEYRLMSSFPEVNDCLEKISNSFINEDERGDVVRMRYRDEDLPSDYARDLQEDWREYIEIFDLKRNGRKMCNDFLTDGELYFELLVETSTPEHKKRGVIGARRLQTELMETVYKDKCNGLVAAYVGRVITHSPADNSQIIDMQYVPFHPNQVCYISSNSWDPTGEWIVPYIERARKRYIQLSYLEDAIIIYRLVRAPERLVFTVDTGNLPTTEAEAYIQELKNQYWNQKSFDISKADIMQKFEPQSMLDAFWIAKGAGNDGVQITQLAGGHNLDQLEDLNYFIKALYRAMHVPTNYLDPSAQTSMDASSILREELDYAEFIVNIQKMFTEPIKQGWITSLKLKGKWKQYELQEKMIDIEFNPPNAYYELRKLQIWKEQYAAYAEGLSSDTLSRSILMKRILKWTNEEIIDNMRLKRKEAAFDWELSQIQEAGPMWKTQAIQAAADAAAETAGGGDHGGDFGGDFGSGFGGGGEGGLDLPEADFGIDSGESAEINDAAGAAGDVLGSPDEGRE